MFRRRRPLLRAAVVGGGAYMAGKSVARNRANQDQAEAEQDARLDDLEQQQQGSYQQAPPQSYQQAPQQYQQAPYQQAPPPPQAPPASSPMVDQLNQLAELHQQGVLTDDEFAAAKAKLFST